MEKTTLDYLRIINKIHHLTSEEIIHDVDWDILCQSNFFVYELLKKEHFFHFNYLPKHYFDDPFIALLLMNYQHPPVTFIPAKLFKNTSFLCSLLDNHFSHIQYIPDDYISEELLLWFCDRFGEKPHLLSFLKPHFINQTLAKILVSKNGLHFKDLPLHLKNDLEIFLATSKSYYVQNFIEAGNHIKSNPYVVTQVLEEEPKLYTYIDESLKTSDFFLRKLSNIPNLLQYATDEIKDNENCVWASVKVSPTMLYFASSRLLNTASFCLQVYQDLSPDDINISIKALSEKVLSDKHMILALLPKLCITSAFEHVSPHLKSDRDVMFNAVTIDMKWFSSITEPLASDYSFFIECYQYYLKNDLFNSKNLFKFIQKDAFNDALYLYHLYKNFSDTFLTSIYPIISYHDTDLIKELKEAYESGENGILHFMDKIKLHFDLEEDLEKKHSGATTKI